MNFFRTVRSKRKRNINEESEEGELVEPQQKKVKSVNVLSRFFKSVKNKFSSLFKESSSARRRRIFGTPAVTRHKNKKINKYVVTPMRCFSPGRSQKEWRTKYFFTLNEVLSAEETKNVEFKTGGGNYPIQILPEHVRKYGSAFLNADGGILLAGVLDNGVVRGIIANAGTQRIIAANVNSEFSKFTPRVDPSMYTLNFVPVAYSKGFRKTWENFLKDVYVLELCVKKGAETEIYEDGRHNVFVRREASVEGPLNPIKIQEMVIQKYIKVLHNQKQNDLEGSCDDSIVCLGVVRPSHSSPPEVDNRKRTRLEVKPN